MTLEPSINKLMERELPLLSNGGTADLGRPITAFSYCLNEYSAGREIAKMGSADTLLGCRGSSALILRCPLCNELP